ncbi:MAG: protein kinase, partial [Myxococcota bacterium]
VHRDLKPSNVLLHRVPHGLVPKVGDFGIAKVLEEGPGSNAAPETRAGIAMGTPGFMPPEQLVDAASVDPRADIFALGCLAFCMASGQRPFPRGHHLAQLRAMMKGRAPQIGRLVPALGPTVRQLVGKAMAFDKEERFQSCAELLNAIDAVPEHELAERLPMPNPQDDQTHPLLSLEIFAEA